MYDLKDIPFEKDLKFASFDITNIYTNIPTCRLINVISNICEQNDLDLTMQTEIRKLCDIILIQDYFLFDKSQYIQEQGIVMGAPTSSIF